MTNNQRGAKYPVLLRSLRRRRGFGLAFVQCSPAQGTELARRLREDLPQKRIEVLELTEAMDELYPVVEALPNRDEIDILLVAGLEKSLVAYIREGEAVSRLRSTQEYGGAGGYYQRDSVPRIMGHLNIQRERFRDDFAICFVFLLPRFALAYFQHHAADFFDWRSGVYEMKADEALVAQEASRFLEDSDWDTYRSLTPEQRQERLLTLQDAIDEPLQTTERKAQLWREKGRLYAAVEEYEAALSAYDKAVEIKPDFHEAWNNRGIALKNLRRYEEAIASYDKAVDLKPDFHQAWCLRGNALYDLARDEEAIASYDKAVDLKPDFHEAWFLRGNALRNLGRYEEAIASYDKAVEFQPDFHPAWNNRGYALGNLGLNEEAVSSFDKAVKFQPDFHQSWNGRGYVLGNLGRHEEAVASYDKAIEFQPDFQIALHNRGYALGRLGRYEEAVTSFNKAIEFKPNDHQSWFFRGITLRNLERYEEALTSIDKALEIQPDFHSAWNSRGYVLMDLERYEEALTSLDKAIAFQSDFHIAWHNRGYALRYLKRYEEAIESHLRALQIRQQIKDPQGEANSLLALGHLYQLCGKVRESWAVIFKAKAIQFSQQGLLQQFPVIFAGIIYLALWLVFILHFQF